MHPCPGCGAQVAGQFCSSCGQRQGDLIPSLAEWLRGALDELLLVEARLPRTLRALFLRPGSLTRHWAEGRRSPYVAPLRLYLFAALVFFVVWPLTAATQGEYFNELIEGFAMGLSESPEEALSPEWQAAQQRLAGRVISVLQFFLIVVSVPLLAWINRGAWNRDHRAFVHQIVFSLHYHAVALIVIAVLLCAGAMVSALWRLDLLYLALLAVFIPSLHNAFGSSWARATVRGLVVFLTFTFVASGLTVGFAWTTLQLWR